MYYIIFLSVIFFDMDCIEILPKVHYEELLKTYGRSRSEFNFQLKTTRAFVFILEEDKYLLIPNDLSDWACTKFIITSK